MLELYIRMRDISMMPTFNVKGALIAGAIILICFILLFIISALQVSGRASREEEKMEFELKEKRLKNILKEDNNEEKKED